MFGAQPSKKVSNLLSSWFKKSQNRAPHFSLSQIQNKLYGSTLNGDENLLMQPNQQNKITLNRAIQQDTRFQQQDVKQLPTLQLVSKLKNIKLSQCPDEMRIFISQYLSNLVDWNEQLSSVLKQNANQENSKLNQQLIEKQCQQFIVKQNYSQNCLNQRFRALQKQYDKVVNIQQLVNSEFQKLDEVQVLKKKINKKSYWGNGQSQTDRIQYPLSAYSKLLDIYSGETQSSQTVLNQIKRFLLLKVVVSCHNFSNLIIQAGEQNSISIFQNDLIKLRNKQQIVNQKYLQLNQIIQQSKKRVKKYAVNYLGLSERKIKDIFGEKDPFAKEEYIGNKRGMKGIL